MSSLPRPGALGLPAGSVVAVPPQGLTLYRLVRGPVPGLADFLPMSPARAARRHTPELLRLALSCFLEAAQAEAMMTHQGSRVARLGLRPGRAHVARTGHTPGHVSVWAPVDELLSAVEVEPPW